MKVKALGFFVGFSLLLTMAMTLTWGNLPAEVEEGKIAKQDLRADRDYEIIDEEETRKLQRKAVESIEPVWMIDEETHKNKINEEETDALREKAFESVVPLKILIAAGESVFRLGDRITSRHVKIVDGIRKEKSEVLARTRLLGTFSFILILSSSLFFVLSRNRRRFRLQWKDHVFLMTLLFLMVVIHRVFIFMGGLFHNSLPFEVPLSAFYALVPIAAGAMMVRLVLPLSVAIAFSTMSASLAGMILQGNLHQMIYYLLGGLVGMQLMTKIRSRGQILKAGFWLGLFNIATVISLELINFNLMPGDFSTQEWMFRLSMALISGFLSSIFVLIFMPFFESVFNYLTPIKLLEYGSLNHPILREMLVQAPGTYHHSHMVGTLAEAACEAIGADSLFARVACYFHDIGKMKKSPYFIENSSPGDDRHVALSPSMSALIIVSHVKDGMELAKSYKLPQQIIDIIPQHQGTKLISYFYNKAKEREDKDTHIVEENAYRYPGPKPQTREAGVILLADTIEAATRSLKDRSPARLEEVIRNMINKNFIDGQLDECELTLKDLHIIAKSFVRILMGIYHNRIEYPPDATDKAVADIAAGKDNADKYRQSTLLQKDSLKEPKAGNGKNNFFSRH